MSVFTRSFMEYRDYSPTDFALDAYFQQWVQHPDEETNAFWGQWLTQHPEKREMVSEAREIVLAMCFPHVTYSQAYLGRIWQGIDERTSVRKANDSGKVAKRRAVLRFFRYGQLAAAVALLIVAVWGITWWLSFTRQNTAYGETREIVLPDNSVITLNANSSLRYHADWTGRKTREVWLTGEAFFNVRRKPATKFVVHTGSLDVEVLGTQFNVNARRGKTQVILNSGKVKLRRDQDSVFMQPGDMVELSEQQPVFAKKIVNPATYSAWRTQQLVFNKTSLTEIAQIMEDSYGWNVVIGDSALAQQTFTATISSNQPALLLNLLVESFDVKITRKANRITIEKNE